MAIKHPKKKGAQSENKFTASTPNIVHKAISRLISNLLQGTDDRNYFNGEGGGKQLDIFIAGNGPSIFIILSLN
jgi:hypothetical protein